MELKIKSNRDRYYRDLIEILGSIKPFNTLNGRERDVLSVLMYSNYLLRNTPEGEERSKLLFGDSVKKRIMFRHDMSKASLANNFSSLRKKGFITYKAICKPYDIMPSKSVTFKFEIENDN